MKIAYVSTYLPQQCGIATYTDYFNIGGIGSFHTIYLIAFLALLIGSIFVCG